MGALDIPVFHDRMVPQLLDKRGQHLRKGDGTVLAARAPHSDGKLAFALFHIERQCVSTDEAILQEREKLMIVVKENAPVYERVLELL